MSGTLADAKAALGHVQRQISDHPPGDCPLCLTTAGKRCAELRGLGRQARELKEQIGTWFAPPPGAATLFDDRSAR